MDGSLNLLIGRARLPEKGENFRGRVRIGRPRHDEIDKGREAGVSRGATKEGWLTPKEDDCRFSRRPAPLLISTLRRCSSRRNKNIHTEADDTTQKPGTEDKMARTSVIAC